MNLTTLAKIKHIIFWNISGRINFTIYQSRGLDEATASQLIIMGFLEPFTKQLPMEYAVELDRLIKFQMEGSIG